MDKETVLITGGGGFVGANILAQGLKRFRFTALEQNPAADFKDEVEWITMDLRDERRISQIFDTLKPSAVIHTAAISDIDICEADRALAEEMNVELTRRVAALSAAGGAHLIFFSTDTVFDGKRGGYTEEDEPHPLNFYGEPKVKSESIVLNSGGPAAVVRLSLVMGLPVITRGNSFLAKMLDTLGKGEPVYFPSAETRTPLDVITLSRSVLEIAERGLTGIFHLAGNDRMTRFDMAGRIAAFYGFDQALVRDQLSDPAKKRAPRPADASLDNGKAKRILKTPMLGFEEALNLVQTEWRRMHHE
jgi:dTDP-4-dehydrorhamnose reductase